MLACVSMYKIWTCLVNQKSAERNLCFTVNIRVCCSMFRPVHLNISLFCKHNFTFDLFDSQTFCKVYVTNMSVSGVKLCCLCLFLQRIFQHLLHTMSGTSWKYRQSETKFITNVVRSPIRM